MGTIGIVYRMRQMDVERGTMLEVRHLVMPRRVSSAGLRGSVGTILETMSQGDGQILHIGLVGANAHLRLTVASLPFTQDSTFDSNSLTGLGPLR